MRLDKRWCLLVALVALLAVLVLLNLGRFLSLSSINDSQADLQAWRAGLPVTAALLAFLGYVAVITPSLPDAAVLTLAAGALFGLTRVSPIASFVSSIGATLACLAARWLMSGWWQSRLNLGCRSLQTLFAGHAGLLCATPQAQAGFRAGSSRLSFQHYGWALKGAA